MVVKNCKTSTSSVPGAFADAPIVGNPVRKDVLALPLPEERLSDRDGKIRVLVVGGSQGARILNQVMPEVAEKVGKQLNIWHQAEKAVRKLQKRCIMNG